MNRIRALVVGVVIVASTLMVAQPASAYTASCSSSHADFTVYESWALLPDPWVLRFRQRWAACWNRYGHLTSESQSVTTYETSYGYATGIVLGDYDPPYRISGTSDYQTWGWYRSFRVCYPYKVSVCGGSMTLGGQTTLSSPARRWSGTWYGSFNIRRVSGAWGWYPAYYIRRTA